MAAKYELRVIETDEVVECDSAETLADWARARESAVTSEWRAYIRSETAHVFAMGQRGELTIEEMEDNCVAVSIEALDKILRVSVSEGVE